MLIRKYIFDIVKIASCESAFSRHVSGEQQGEGEDT
jgi:hypothetical protein